WLLCKLRTQCHGQCPPARNATQRKRIDSDKRSRMSAVHWPPPHGYLPRSSQFTARPPSVNSSVSAAALAGDCDPVSERRTATARPSLRVGRSRADRPDDVIPIENGSAWIDRPGFDETQGVGPFVLDVEGALAPRPHADLAADDSVHTLAREAAECLRPREDGVEILDREVQRLRARVRRAGR